MQSLDAADAAEVDMIKLSVSVVLLLVIFSGCASYFKPSVLPSTPIIAMAVPMAPVVPKTVPHPPIGPRGFRPAQLAHPSNKVLCAERPKYDKSKCSDVSLDSLWPDFTTICFDKISVKTCTWLGDIRNWLNGRKIA